MFIVNRPKELKLLRYELEECLIFPVVCLKHMLFQGGLPGERLGAKLASMLRTFAALVLHVRVQVPLLLVVFAALSATMRPGFHVAHVL